MRHASEINTSNIRTNNTALRLVSTKDMSREDWLAIRKQGIGASDAAAAVGLSPYQSPLELWMIKTGRDGDMPKVDPNDESSPMYWGNILEPIVAQHPDPDKSWMLANLDYTVVGSDDVQILECKTAGEFGSRLWRDGVPEYVQCQVQHQLAVTGKASADVCVLICGQEIRIHRIERDDELIAKLIELERQFWYYVETDTPPPADGSESSGKALKYLYQYDSGDVLDLTTDPYLCQVFTDLLVAREDVSRAEQIEAERKQTIQQRMGEASKVIFPNAVVTWKRNKAGSRRFLIHV